MKFHCSKMRFYIRLADVKIGYGNVCNAASQVEDRT